MASSREYLQYILEQLSELEEITYREMMGEFIIYYRNKIIGGIYDDVLGNHERGPFCEWNRTMNNRSIGEKKYKQEY